MRLGFTGTRMDLTLKQRTALVRAFQWFRPKEFVHGDCFGADTTAHNYADAIRETIGLTLIKIRPSTAKSRAFNDSEIAVVYPAKEPLVRNKDIVDDVDVMVACPQRLKEELRSGTWHAIRYSLGKKPVLVIWPTGKVSTLLTRNDLNGR